MYLFRWLFICIFHNKSINVFPRVLWAVTASYQTWGQGGGNPWVIGKPDKSVGNVGAHCLGLTSEVGAVLWDWTLNLWLFYLTGILSGILYTRQYSISLISVPPGCFLRSSSQLPSRPFFLNQGQAPEGKWGTVNSRDWDHTWLAKPSEPCMCCMASSTVRSPHLGQGDALSGPKNQCLGGWG